MDQSFDQKTVSSWEHGFGSAGDGLGDGLRGRNHAGQIVTFDSEREIGQTLLRHILN